MTNINFGTDGWRAVVGEDFNKNNTDKVINALSIYMYNQTKFEKKVLIGYDPRNKADEFAFYIAEKLSEYGFYVEISNKIVATPVLAYSALIKNAYAIMLTASHNPPEYLGIKFIPPYGGPADDSIVNEIVKNLNSDFVNKEIKKQYESVSFEEDYLNHIKTIINFDIIKKSGITVNYDGHHGAAGKLFKRILDLNNIKNNSNNLERDINFGGYMPDPKEKYLPELKKICIETGCIGLSNDGDGDRFGVFDEEGVFISANDIIVMLLNHLVKNRKYTGKLAKTVGASSMLNVFAQKLGIEVVETPVGFKWLGEVMRNDDIIIAGEESGGLSIKGHIPEKDGILANLLIIEMMAYYNNKLSLLHKEFLNSLDCNFINDRIDLKLQSKEKQDEIINQYKNLDFIGNYKIIKKVFLDGLKMYLQDGSWILIRKSGTEPLLRIYFESDKEEKLSELKHLIQG